METKLKQRAIGAIVLTCLAIIILPMLLDGSPEDRERVLAEIPAPPMITLKELSVEDIERRMQQDEIESEAQLPKFVEDVESDKNEAEVFKLDANQLPISWSLQLGSFRNAENARVLRQKLRENDYRSYIIEADTETGRTLRVLVGPMLDRVALEETAVQIKRIFNIEGRIVRYNILDDKGQIGG
ncbi:MAG: DedD protein [Candidatus Azotimanducaceae bacterium]